MGTERERLHCFVCESFKEEEGSTKSAEITTCIKPYIGLMPDGRETSESSCAYPGVDEHYPGTRQTDVDAAIVSLAYNCL